MEWCSYTCREKAAPSLAPWSLFFVYQKYVIWKNISHSFIAPMMLPSCNYFLNTFKNPSLVCAFKLYPLYTSSINITNERVLKAKPISQYLQSITFVLFSLCLVEFALVRYHWNNSTLVIINSNEIHSFYHWKMI